jgi:hypothetical protein
MYYYTNGRPDEEKLDPGIDESAHGTLWQRVRCAMQSDDAITPQCRKPFGRDVSTT